MNYEPNTTHWNIGDLVLHDADAKHRDMIARVIGYTRDGLCKTRYIHTHTNGHWHKSTRKIWINRLEVLHDPKRFGVTE